MEERLPKRSPTEEDSNHFTFLSDPKGGSMDQRTSSHNSNLQPRVPPMHSLQLFQMDLFSPSKEDEVPMATTPRHKRRASDSHTGLTPGISELLPSKAKRSRVSAEFNSDSDKSPSLLSPIKSLAQPDSANIEMNASHVFANSPGSPSSEFKAMMDEIEVSPAAEPDGEDFLRRQSKHNMRRCRSLELRKKLIDMTNTPPSGFKKSLFKKPADPVSEVKSPSPEEIEPECHKMSLTYNETPSPEEVKSLRHKTVLTFNETDVDETSESEDHIRIKQAVDMLQSHDLIADGSRHYCLPLVKGKHTDLQNIDHETMAMLVSNRYPKVFDKFTIIDCRYPYEYSGGHIRGSRNIYTEEATVEFLNKEVKESTTDSQKHILVFHCEFSSHRGPNLLRHLRNCDRQMNLHQYPQLAFPEIYCLFGGYKEFYTHHPDLCDPSSYTPMVDEKYASDLRHFRAKAKSWAAGDRLKLKQQQHL